MDKIYIYIIIWVFIWVLAFWISVVLKFSRKRKLTTEQKRHFKKHFHKIKKSISNKEKIIYYDKLYHNILKSLGYEWTFWEILRSYPNEINNIDKIFHLHKLRNKLVHELDTISDNKIHKEALDYEKEIFIFLK